MAIKYRSNAAYQESRWGVHAWSGSEALLTQADDQIDVADNPGLGDELPFWLSSTQVGKLADAAEAF